MADQQHILDERQQILNDGQQILEELRQQVTEEQQRLADDQLEEEMYQQLVASAKAPLNIAFLRVSSTSHPINMHLCFSTISILTLT